MAEGLNIGKSAKESNLALCLNCHKVNEFSGPNCHCSRCYSQLFLRKTNSIEYTLAWTIAAIIAFIPANTLPVMTFYSLGSRQASTIISGIEAFFQLGMYPVAIIVFIASFLVPLGKIIGLLFLVYAIKRQAQLTPQQCNGLYHLIEFLGPWSMLDVFVVALMAAVLNLGFISSIEAGPGITFFAVMVVFTMFAAHSFDPRLIWDNQKND